MYDLSYLFSSLYETHITINSLIKKKLTKSQAVVTPVIHGTWEVEMVGFQFEGSLGKNVNKTLSQRIIQMWWHVPII
jgi:hypothetical protein